MMSTDRLARLPSFRRQSTLLHGGLVALVALALACVFGVAIYRQIERDDGMALHVVAQNVARTLATGLDDRSRQVEALANDAELWSHGLSGPAVRAALERAKASTPHSSWLGVADVDGRVRESTSGILAGHSVAARPWFQQGLTQRHVGDVHGALLLSKFLPAPASGEPLRFVDFSAPIRRDGQVIGVLGQHGSWDWARAVVSLLAPENASALGLEIFIFDKSGLMIYSPANHAAAKARDEGVKNLAVREWLAAGGGATIARWEDGEPYLTAAVAMKVLRPESDLGWTVVVREPEAVAYASARGVLRWALVIGLASAAIAGSIANVVSLRMSRPLSRIAASAKDVACGRAGASIRIDTTNVELADLSLALSGMTRQLIASQEQLEERVRERTLELAEANKELYRLSRFDPLTGLMNRRAFEERMAIALASAKRSGGVLSLLIVDVDHFKNVNDRFGHEAGDRVLVRLAGLLCERLRETDAVARLGGEEFAVLLPETGEEGALRVAEQLLARAAGTEIAGVGRVTVSVGSATRRWSPQARDLLMRAADAALYDAKQAGRNRVRQSGDAELAPAV